MIETLIGNIKDYAESITEPTKEVTIDDEENIVDDMGNAEEQPDGKVALKTDNASKNDWFKQSPRPPTSDSEWNKDRIVDDQPEQPWFNDLVSAEKYPLTFDELMATPINFSKFAMNSLKLEKITKADLVGPVYNLLKGTCQSSIELEYNMEECYKALFDQLDWANPKGDRCPFDLSKPLLLKGRPGHLTIHAEYFFNNDLEYLKSRYLERKYTKSITKTKAARYELVGIKDMIPKQWSVVKVGYNKEAAFGILRWGPKRQLFYRSQINRLSRHDVYSTLKILSVVSVTINKQFSYGNLKEIVKNRHLEKSQRCPTWCRKLPEEAQYYQASKGFSYNSAIEPYTLSFNPKRVVYEDLSNRKRLMRAYELYKFSDEMIKSVRDTLHYKLLNFRLDYNKDMSRRKWTATDRDGQASWLS
ncbi:hypothetical protein Tco_1102153 [Tanacetum coccineum]